MVNKSSKTLIEQERIIKLSDQDAEFLFHVLENPPDANPHLQKATARYKLSNLGEKSSN